MLDLLISYVNFLILSISYIVKRFTFFPPSPAHYKSIQTEDENEEDILFLLPQNKKKKMKYIGIEFRLLDYRFIKIIYEKNNYLPLLLFHPPSHLPICIIYSHGNSGDLGSCLLEYYDIALHTNCLVVSFEYPGYGECKDQPMKESEFYKNLEMTYYFVRKVLGFKTNQIILYGFSLGTGIMFEIACKKEYPAAGLILQSPFLSIVRTLYDVNVTSYYDLFNNCDKAKYLKIKTLFIHGNRDKMVPYIHGRILSKLIPQQYFYDFLTVDKADHNNIFKGNKDLIYNKIRQFIKDCTGKYSDFDKKTIDKENNNIVNTEDNLKTNFDNNDDQNYPVEGEKKDIDIKNKKVIKNITNNKPYFHKIINNNCQNLCPNNIFNNELRILMDNNYDFNKNFYPSKLYGVKNYHNQNFGSEQHYSFYQKNKNNIYNTPPYLEQIGANNIQNQIYNSSTINNNCSKNVFDKNENSYTNFNLNNSM